MKKVKTIVFTILILILVFSGCSKHTGASTHENSFGFTAQEFRSQFENLSESSGKWIKSESTLNDNVNTYLCDFGNGVNILISAYKDTDTVYSVFTKCKTDKMNNFMSCFTPTVAICDKFAITGEGNYTIDNVLDELGVFDEESYNKTNKTIEKDNIKYRFIANENSFSVNIFYKNSIADT